MTTQDLQNLDMFQLIVQGDEKKITSIYCADLLSWAMGKAPENAAWCTVMGNVNAIAVASLTDVAVLVICENAVLDDAAKQKAQQQAITVITTSLPAFEAGCVIAQYIEK